MLLISDRQLTLHNIERIAGEAFDEPDEKVAEDLISRGVCRKHTPPKVFYETKPARFEKPEVKPETGVPFRHMPVHHSESPELAAESDSVLPATDVPEQGTSDNRRRRRRARFGSQR